MRVRNGGTGAVVFARGRGEERETVAFVETQIEMDLRPVAIGIEHVARARRRTLEPANVLRRPTVTRHEGDVHFLVGMPLVVRSTSLGDLEVRDQREEREHHPFVRDCEIVHARGVRHLEPDFLLQLAIRAEDVERDVARGVATGLVGEREQLVCDRVHLRMRCQRRRTNRATDVIAAHRGQRVGIDPVRQIVFLQRIQPPGVEHRGGVARAHVHTGDARIVRITIAITPEETALRRLLQLVALGVHPLADVVDLPILEAEHVHHALAVDEDVIGAAGGY